MLSAPVQAPVSRGELRWLAIGVAVSLAIHAAFILHGLGEPDAARLTREAIVWAEVGQMPAIGYTPRTSPLYIHWMKKMLTFGLPPLWLPAVMNWTSMVLGSLALVPLYLVWRRIASPAAAAVGLIVYSFMPAWWLGNIYGMPLVPAFFCFACSLVLFGRWLALASSPSNLCSVEKLRSPCSPIEPSMCPGRLAPHLHSQKRLFLPLKHISVLSVNSVLKDHFPFLQSTNLKSQVSILGAAILAVVAVMLKADVVLCYGMFLLLALWTSPIRFRNIASALAIPLVAVWLTTQYTKAISPRVIYSTETWSKRWGFTWDVLTVWDNARVPLVAAGAVLAGIIVVLLLYSIVMRRHGAVLLLVLFWGAPAILFWCSKTGNSSRHMMAAYAPLALLVGAVLTQKWDWRKWAPALVAILALNYTATDMRDMPDTVRPASNIFTARGQIQTMLDIWHGAGRDFALLPDKQKILYGEDNSTYAVWEVLARAKRFRDEKDGPGYVVTNPDGTEQTVRIIYHLRTEEQPIPEPGWSTWLWLDYTVPVKLEDAE